jgi:hypothetical protein
MLDTPVNVTSPPDADEDPPELAMEVGVMRVRPGTGRDRVSDRR